MKRRGFTLVEVLISVVILAGLAAASFSTFSASASLADRNVDIARNTQAGRLVINRITTQARQASAINVNGTTLTLSRTDAPSVVYTYNSTLKLLQVSENAGTKVIAARGVTSVSYAMSGSSLAITLTIKTDRDPLVLHGSAAVRRMLVDS